jgi:hypothetical protein
MRFRRPRRRNLILLSTRAIPPRPVPLRAVPPSRLRRPARAVRRRWFRFARTGFLLAVIGAARLAQSARSHWRVSLALCGLLLEIAGHSVLAGPARGAADLAGLAIVVTAVLRSGRPAGDHRPALPQAAWRWHA